MHRTASSGIGWAAIVKTKVKRPNPPRATPKRRESWLRQAERAVTVSLLNGIKTFKNNIPKAKLDDMYREGKYDDMYRELPWPQLEAAMLEGDAHLSKSRLRIARQELAEAALREARAQPSGPSILPDGSPDGTDSNDYADAADIADMPRAQSERSGRSRTIGTGDQTIDAVGADEADRSVSLDYVADRVLGQRPGKPTAAAPDGRLKRMIPDIQGEARDHIKETVALGAATGMTPRMVSDRIVEGLILNPRQKKALSNFRTQLEESGKHSPAVIEKKVAQYESRLQRQRADMIAVTETRVAAGQTELKSWQAQEQTGLIDAGAQRQWLAEPDACDEICKPMDGTIIGINDMWELPDGRSIQVNSESHPRCRCSEDLVAP